MNLGLTLGFIIRRIKTLPCPSVGLSVLLAVLGAAREATDADDWHADRVNFGPTVRRCNVLVMVR